MRYGLVIGSLGLALALAGCGVRGDLELPPRAVAAEGADGVADAEPKPERRFVLDPLL